jgi:outer membrane protein assembly factor BamE (lipoprotein component of BamABCDE complex)
MKKVVILFLSLVFIFSIIGCSQSDGTQASDLEPEGIAQDTQKYNLEMYMQIKPGFTYEEVQTILGDPGENMVDNDRLKQYQWTNEDESMISVTFYENEVTAKSQAHLGPLRAGKNAVTLEMYNKLKEGMTLEEVTDILGPGTERMLFHDEGKEEVIMGWDNSDGSGISVTLFDGEVTKKSDMMLK